MTGYVALYCRLSPKRNGKGYEGVRDQEVWGRRYAAATWPGIPIKVYSDTAISAGNGDVRPGLEDLRADIAAGIIVHAWAVEQSRISRETDGRYPWFTLAAELEAAGIAELHTDRDGIVKVSDEVAGIKAVLAAGERRKMLRRQSDTLAQIAARGEPPGSKPFGYQHGLNAEGRRTYIVIPEQAAAIRLAAEKILAGWSLSNVAATLREQGMRGAHGGRITASSVKGFLTSPTVAGLRVHQRKVVGPGGWEAILSEDTLQALRRKLTGPRVVDRATGGKYAIGELHRGRQARRYLLTGGLAVCGLCGHRLLATMKQLRGRARVKPYYLCHPNVGGRGCVGIMGLEFEQYVVDQVLDRTSTEGFLSAVAVDDLAAQRDEIQAGLDRIDRRREDLAQEWAGGDLDTTEWRAARVTLDDKERKLRAELAGVPPSLTGFDVAKMRKLWPNMPLDEKRDFLGRVLDRVYVRRATPGTNGFDPRRVEIMFTQWGRH